MYTGSQAGAFSLKRSDERGFALIFTMWTAVILAVLLGTLGLSVRTGISYAGYENDRVQAYFFARAGLNRMAAELTTSDNSLMGAGGAEVLGRYIVNYLDGWQIEKLEADEDLPEGDYIYCEVTAEDAKFPLSMLTSASAGMIDALEPEEAAALKAHIADKNADTPEYYLRKGIISPKSYFGSDRDNNADKKTGFAGIVTAYSDGRLNLNGANADAVKLLTGIDADTAAEIAESVQKEPLLRIEQLQNIIGITPLIYRAVHKSVKVETEYYRIVSASRYKRIDSTAEAVFKADGEKLVIVYRKGG